jgi:hypothetical protein
LSACTGLLKIESTVRTSLHFWHKCLCKSKKKITSNIKIKSLHFVPYGRSIGSWICFTHKTYTYHTVQNTIRYDIRCKM